MLLCSSLLDSNSLKRQQERDLIAACLGASRALTPSVAWCALIKNKDCSEEPTQLVCLLLVCRAGLAGLARDGQLTLSGKVQAVRLRCS